MSASPQRPTTSSPTAGPASNAVPFSRKLAYGVGGLPAFFGNVGVKSLAIPVYQMTLRMDPALLGLLLALPRLWDAVTDPLMGFLSDRSKLKQGRRRPFIALGAVLTALSFVAIWMVPTDWASSAQSMWFLVTSLVFFTCFTIWSVPYTSLGFEITPDYHERTSVMGIRLFFNKCGEFVYQWIFPLAQLAIFASVMQGVQIVTIAIAVVVFLGLGLLPAIFTKERFIPTPVTPRHSPPIAFAQPRFWSGYAALLRSRAIVVLIGLSLLRLLLGVFTSALDHYVLVYHMFDGDVAAGSVWKGVLSTGYAVVGMLAIIPVGWCCRRFDKKRTLLGIFALTVFGGLAKWFIFQSGHSPWWILLDPILNGLGLVAVGMIVPSMLADVCDFDEWQFGHRREGMISAFMTWVQKTGSSLAFLFTGVILNTIGFDAALGGDQPDSATLAMRLILAGSAVVMALLSMLVIAFYPLTEDRMREIRHDLEARRGAV